MTDLLLDDAEPALAVSTAQVRDLLRKRFAQPEWALLEEVAPKTGGGTRYADAVAVNLWKSRGYAVYGFEIKVSRADWLRERRQPQKTEESVFAYCDRWYVVAPRGIVQPGELPPTWGLFEVRRSGLVAKVDAPPLSPASVDRAFFASLMRRGHEQIQGLALDLQRASIDEAQAAMQESIAREVAERTRQHTRLQERVEAFTQATGLSLDDYGRAPSITAIKLAQKLESLSSWKDDGALGRLLDLAEQLERAARTVRDAVGSADLVPPATCAGKATP